MERGRALVIGGGPAGLTAAWHIAQCPGWQVAVYEARPFDERKGWGLTLPTELLGLLGGELDVPSARIVGPPQILVGDRTLAARALEEVATVDRSELLTHLRRRCREAGVELTDRFAVELDDPVLQGASVTIAADGTHSQIRAALATELGTSIHRGRTLFCWLSTPRPFPHLSVCLQESSHGPMLAWAYSYSPNRSTFIVECSSETVARAKLDSPEPDDVCQRLADLFVDLLEGEPLLHSGAVRWSRFEVVGNRNWSHEPIVLIGDAAHTTHFCVGSGTAEAVKDAVSLARALVTCTDVATALDAFEAHRKPVVCELQRRASRWAELWEALLHEPEASRRRALMERLAAFSRSLDSRPG